MFWLTCDQAIFFFFFWRGKKKYAVFFFPPPKKKQKNNRLIVGYVLAENIDIKITLSKLLDIFNRVERSSLFEFLFS